jgi:hypothetical protein
MKRLKCVLTAVLLLPLTMQLGAQTPDAQAQPAPAAAPSPAWSVGSIDFSGLIDAYYGLNFNHPESRKSQLRNFDVMANQFSLNMAKLTMNHDADPVGFRVDLGFGRAFDMVHAAEAAPGIFRNIEQAYVTLKPKKANGLTLDFGKFTTSAGAEVIETNSNWNYSRSLLFALAVPYYHFGLRVTEPMGSHFTAGVQLVNGWNNVEDNNSGKTVGLIGNVTTSKFTWSNNYYVGREKTYAGAGTDDGLRHLYDTTLLLTPSSKANFYINYDYGVDKNVLGGENRWVGVAGAARFALNDWFALSPRLEWFNDATGFATGAVQKLKEFTMTAEFKAKEGVLARVEYRRDWSDVAYFDRGSTAGVWKNQPTLTAGFVAFFGPKR